MTLNVSLYERQMAGLEMLKDAARRGKRRIILQAPTAFGKTVVAAAIVDGAMAKKNRVAFTAPTITLIDQTFDRFAGYGISPGDMGVVQGNHPWHRPSAPIQICSPLSVAKRGFPDSSVIVVDECHIRLEAIDQWMGARPQALFVGLSATPWSKGLGDKWEELAIPATLQQMIDERKASRFVAYAPFHPDLTGIKDVAGDYHQGQLSDRLRKPKIVADIVDTWLAMAQGRPTLVFAVDRAHAAEIHQKFADEGICSAYVDAETPREERKKLGESFNRRETQVIVSIDTMSAGTDLDVRCVVLGRPTKSEIQLVQMVGRGLRVAPDKDHCLILDHSDSLLNLGLPTDIHHDTLHRSGEQGGETAKNVVKLAPKPRECGACKAVIPPMIRACPGCGWVLKVECHVTTIPGKLVNFEEALAEQMKKPKTKRVWTPDLKARFYAELAAYGLERGFKEGWAAFMFKEKFGLWPGDDERKTRAVFTCGPGVRGWVKSQMIRRAKGRQGGGRGA